MMNRIGNAALVAAAMLALASPALAADAGGDGWGTLAAHAINLALLLGLIVYFAKRPIQRGLKARAAEVGKDIAEASRLHAEAESMLSGYEAKLAKLEAQAQEMLEAYRAEGEADKARLISEGQADAQRIRDEARRTAATEVARARERLEAEVVDMAIAAARAAISEKITPADDRRLTADYLSRLEEASSRG
jgi:F-type H+-transporting ATPase subunit b